MILSPPPPKRRDHNSRVCPIPGCSGGEVFAPFLSTHPHPCRVALVGEALGAVEAETGRPFDGKAGFKLTRLLEWAGYERERFDIWNAVWCHPPDNILEGTPYEEDAITFWKPYWRALLSRVDVVVPMGNVALGAFTGMKGILQARGYFTESIVFPGLERERVRLLPTIHPSFIQRGQSHYSAAFINDIQKAVAVTQVGMTFEVQDYVLDPSPGVAYIWAQAYRAALALNPQVLLAYDIETPGKGVDAQNEDASYFIWRMGFAYKPFNALSVPFTPAYIPTIKLLLGSSGEKVVWNAHFDNPRLKHHGIDISGLIHDGMIAWHIWHSDLPKGLGFVATFTCPFQPRWKHLSTVRPAYYNATDADVELRSFLAIEQALKQTGLWAVYQRDVLDLEPILLHMSKMGMPIDPLVQEDRAAQLATKQTQCLQQIAGVVPLEARSVGQVYKRPPADLTGLLRRPGTRIVGVCTSCGLVQPLKDHFKSFVRKVNACANARLEWREQEVEEYYRLTEFTPSQVQLIRYQRVMGRGVPSQWDKKSGLKKPTMNEKSLKQLIKKYPSDPLYPLVLRFRELQKVGGYIGYPE